MRISEEGCAINEFNPDHAIKRWYKIKVGRIPNAKPPKNWILQMPKSRRIQ